MKYTFLILFLLGFFIPEMHAQERNFKKEFDTTFYAGGAAELRTLLHAWEQKKPKDAELFIAWYNYYVKVSKHEVVVLGQNPNGESLELKDQGGNVAGYMGSEMKYDADTMKKAFASIDKGIRLFPDRLDMRFGKVYMLGQTGDYDSFTSELILIIEEGFKIKNNWKWADNAPQKDPEKFMLNAVQEYIANLLDAGDGQAPHIKAVAEAVLKHKPDAVEFISDVAVSYMLNQEWDKALPELFKAEKLNPADLIVLNNIAFSYKQKGDKANAIVYYEKLGKAGTEEDKKRANEAIEKLK
ncbi:MAG: tetratricopeptide repeat protein [Bacteroidia bacterium]